MTFALVRFTEENNAPGIVATNWISCDGNTCLFPNVISDEMKNKLLISQAKPDSSWHECPIRILREFATYHAARGYLRYAKDTSNLDCNSECKKPRKRKRFTRYEEDSSSSEDNISIKTKHCYLSPHPASFETPIQSRQNLIINNQGCKNDNGLHSVIQELQKNQAIMLDLMTELLRVVQRIESKIDALTFSFQSQQNVFYMPEQTNEMAEDLNFISSLPVLEIDAFNKLNRKIAENASFKPMLIKFLMIAGGRDSKALAANVLRKIMVDDVAEQFSLTGKSLTGLVKQPIEKTEIYKLILEICSHTFSDSKENTVREAISDWLHQAKFRKSRREKRRCS